MFHREAFSRIYDELTAQKKSQARDSVKIEKMVDRIVDLEYQRRKDRADLSSVSMNLANLTREMSRVRRRLDALETRLPRAEYKLTATEAAYIEEQRMLRET